MAQRVGSGGASKGRRAFQPEIGEDGLYEFSGEVKRVRVYNDWAIVTLEPRGASNVTLTGELSGLSEGMLIEVRAQYSEHPTYGGQYKVTSFREMGFNSLDGIIAYLSGPSFKSIGPKTARDIAQTFGMDTLRVLDEDPSRLCEVPGLSASRQQQLREDWAQSRETHRQMTELMQLGLSMNLATKAIRLLGSEAARILRDNPYRLTEIHGVGFRKADEVALTAGVARHSAERVCAAIRFALEQHGLKGHCFATSQEVGDSVLDDLLRGDIGQQTLQTCLARLIEEGTVTREENRYYLTHMYLSERHVAASLVKLIQFGAHPLVADREDLVQRLDALGVTREITLAPEQLDGILLALTSPVAVITGGPGVGKSTLTRALSQVLDGLQQKYLLCSPTGRAAKRLAEVTGRSAATIHRTLKTDPIVPGKFLFNASNPFNEDFVIVDETSMVDLSLMRHLLAAVKQGTRVILIGDVDQLPSVGAGNVLRDLIDSEVIPVVRLTQVFRQAAGSAIITAAHAILRGETPELPSPVKCAGKNFMFVSAVDHETLLAHTVTLASRSLAAAGLKPDDIQILTPMREKGVGVNDINPVLQEVFNPPSPDKAEMSIGGGRVFRRGDRVMHLKNNSEKNVFNGDIGKVVDITSRSVDEETGSTNAATLFVRYPDLEAPVEYKGSDLDDLILSYATTVHKVQGAEFPAVIIVCHPSQYVMLQRNLLYTGITRAKKYCILIGTEGAVRLAVSKADQAKRNTRLAQRLRASAGNFTDSEDAS